MGAGASIAQGQCYYSPQAPKAAYKGEGRGETEPSEKEAAVRLSPPRDEQEQNALFERLRNLEITVLDNSVRETTVAQPLGHTVKNKVDILRAVSTVGFQDYIVAAFCDVPSVDEQFVANLVEEGFDLRNCYAFAEVWEEIDDGKPARELTIGMHRLKAYGIPNAILEVDLFHTKVNFESFDLNELIGERIDWIFANLSSESRIYVNIRDFAAVHLNAPQRVMNLVRFLASRPPFLRPRGLLVEEPTGCVLPLTMGQYMSRTRAWMDEAQWDGRLLVHVHYAFGLAEAVVQESLMRGADGIWCGVCSEGAMTGHASSVVTLTNLARMGNKSVLRQFDFPQLLKAANEVTRIVTGEAPPPATEVYGSHAIDTVFPHGMEDAFRLSSLFRKESKVRMSTMATPLMILQRLSQEFGSHHSAFKEELCEKMRVKIFQDLRAGRRHNYDTPVGLLTLFDRCGGFFDKALLHRMEVITEDIENHRLVKELRAKWTECKPTERTSQVDDYLTFKEVFNGFIGKCVALHTYPSAKTALEFLDVDHCGNISWKEFLFRVAWTLQEFEKEIYTVDDILHFMFEKLIFREVAPSIEEEDVVLKEITNSLRSLADTKRDLSDFEEADLGIVI